MDELNIKSPTLPMMALLPAALLCLVLLFLAARRIPTWSGRFLAGAIGLRFILSALRTFTFTSSPLGLSYNALASIAIVGWGVMCIRKRPIFAPYLLAIYPMVIAIVASGVYNHVPVNTFNWLIKLAYFAVIMLATMDVMEDLGAKRAIRYLLPAIATPFFFQLISIVLGVAKAGEADGSQSFIGGYAHEAAFSVALAIGALVICFADNLRSSIKLPLIMGCILAIALANYRTTILAILPMLGVTILIGATSRIKPSQRNVLVLFLSMVVIVAIAGVLFLDEQRFADLSVIASNWQNLIRPPETFTDAERAILSGRTYIWSSYYYAWLASSPMHHIVGLGPDQWAKTFVVYGHNTLVAYLYDLGIIGVISTLILWTTMFVQCLRNRQGPRIRLIAAHISFFILNMATEPMWMIEGMMLYGLLCGMTLYYMNLTNAQRRQDIARFRMTMTRPVGA